MPHSSNSGKNWDAILKEYSSGEDEDAHDCLNVMTVVKNAKRVCEVIHGVVPGLDKTVMQSPFMGMNRSVEFQRNLSDTFVTRGMCASAVPVALPSEETSTPVEASTGPPAEEATSTLVEKASTSTSV